jgi:hypothetical protein
MMKKSFYAGPHFLDNNNLLTSILVSILLINLLAACTDHAASSISVSSSTVPPATAEIIPTISPTQVPEIAKPSISPALLPVNNVTEIWENHAWVVKNAKGQVTAAWDASKNEWVIHRENLQMVLAGETLPISRGGIGSYVARKVVIPIEWEMDPSENNLDENPIVPLGYIGTISEIDGKDTGGNVWHLQEIGVDFRGIKLVQPKSDPKNLTGGDIYLVGFTTSNPQYPDRFYLITIPLIDNGGLYTNVDLFAGGTYAEAIGSNVIIPPPDGKLGEFSLHELIPVLKDPSVVGRRMCLQIWVSDTGKASNQADAIRDAFFQPSQNILVDAIENGTSFDPVETGINEQSLRVPHDLHDLVPEN